MNILALVPYELNHAPGQRLRIECWEPHLRQHGCHVKFLPFTSPQLQAVMHQSHHYGRKLVAVVSTVINYVQQLRTCTISDYDIAFIHREATLIGPPLVERSLTRQGLPYIYDFDDAIFLPMQSQASPLFSLGRWHKKVSELCQNSAHITVGNHYLKRYAQQLNQNVSIIPMGMPLEHIHAKVNYQTNSALVIGWIGSFSTALYVRQIAAVLTRIQQEFNCIIRLIGVPETMRNEFPTFDIRPWQAEREIAEVQAFDIGINPMPINDWTKGKGTGKTLQYLSAGVPCVATPTGSNLDIIQHGVNSFLAQTQDEWYTQLRMLLQDAALRREIGMAGRQTVELSYNLRDHAEQVAAILKRSAR